MSAFFYLFCLSPSLLLPFLSSFLSSSFILEWFIRHIFLVSLDGAQHEIFKKKFFLSFCHSFLHFCCNRDSFPNECHASWCELIRNIHYLASICIIICWCNSCIFHKRKSGNRWREQHKDVLNSLFSMFCLLLPSTYQNEDCYHYIETCMNRMIRDE